MAGNPGLLISFIQPKGLLTHSWGVASFANGWLMLVDRRVWRDSLWLMLGAFSGQYELHIQLQVAPQSVMADPMYVVKVLVYYCISICMHTYTLADWPTVWYIKLHNICAYFIWGDNSDQYAISVQMRSTLSATIFSACQLRMRYFRATLARTVTPSWKHHHHHRNLFIFCHLPVVACWEHTLPFSVLSLT